MDRDQGFGFFRDVVSTLVKVGDCKVLALVLEWESDAMVSSHDKYAIKHTSANVDEFIQPELVDKDKLNNPERISVNIVSLAVHGPFDKTLLKCGIDRASECFYMRCQHLPDGPTGESLVSFPKETCAPFGRS
jgi:hypothetical protein